MQKGQRTWSTSVLYVSGLDGTGWDVDVDRCLPENNGDLARINGCTFTYNLSVGIRRGFP